MSGLDDVIFEPGQGTQEAARDQPCPDEAEQECGAGECSEQKRSPA
jgi:hypothetical protein